MINFPKEPKKKFNQKTHKNFFLPNYNYTFTLQI